MKKILFLIFIFTNIYAQINLDINSFSADFTQEISDENNKIVKYVGKIYAKKPKLAMWSYSKPVEKKVYIEKNSVVVIEPELEQIIIRKLHDDFDIFVLLKNAKKIKNNIYTATYKDVVFELEIENKVIKSISYKDGFDNKVKITFTNQKINQNIDDVIFKPDAPDSYDMIIE